MINEEWIDSFRQAYQSLLKEGMRKDLALREAITFADFVSGLTSTKPSPSSQSWITPEKPRLAGEWIPQKWIGKKITRSNKTHDKRTLGNIYTGNKKYPGFKRIALFVSTLKREKTATKAIGRPWICSFKIKSYSCGKQMNTYQEIMKHFSYVSVGNLSYVQQQCRTCGNRRSRNTKGHDAAKRNTWENWSRWRVNVRKRKDSTLYPKDKNYPYEQKCSHCDVVTAKGYAEVKDKFGFAKITKSKSRNESFRILYPNGVVTQRWCRACRSRMPSTVNALNQKQVRERAKKLMSKNWQKRHWKFGSGGPKCKTKGCNLPAKKTGFDSEGNQKYASKCDPATKASCYKRGGKLF